MWWINKTHILKSCNVVFRKQEHPGFEKKMKIRNIHIPLRARFIFKQHRRKSKWAESMSHRFSSKFWAESLSPMSWIDSAHFNLSWIDSAHFNLSWIDSAHFNLSWIDSAHGTQMWLDFCLALWWVTSKLCAVVNNVNGKKYFLSTRPWAKYGSNLHWYLSDYYKRGVESKLLLLLIGGKRCGWISFVGGNAMEVRIHREAKFESSQEVHKRGETRIE